VFNECLCHSCQCGLGGKIGTHMVRHQDRGTLVDESERFYHMVLFAMGIRWNAGGVFEVELEVAHWRGTFEWLSHRGKARGNASVFVHNPVNSAGRFRQTQFPFFQGFIALQILEDGLGTWCTAQALWGFISDL